MLLLRGTLLSFTLCLAAVAQGRPGPTLQEVLRASDCQTVLPGQQGGGAGGQATPPPGDRSTPRERGEGRGWSFDLDLGPLAQVMLWTGVGVAALLLLAAILRSRGAAAPVAALTPVRGAAPPVDETPEPADHERLAAAGDFRGAVHALLRRAIAAWDAAGASPVHATSRELLRRAQRVMQAVADPFASLVAAVERVHFGGAAADRGLYEASREQLSRWEAACRQPR